MREVDFTAENVCQQWLLVKGFWKDFEGQTIGFVQRSLEQVLQAEVSRRIGGARYERVVDRRDYRNGSYVRELLTSYGWIRALRVPRVRGGGIETVVFEKYRRRQRQLDLVLLEAFLLGHSTRKAGRLFRRLFGGRVSAQTVSQVVKTLDEQVMGFHRRVLSDEYQVVYLDGLWVTLSKPVKTKKVLFGGDGGAL
jgi:putative transposase